MYFWGIERLKDQLVSRPLSEREVLPYVVACGALTSIVANVPAEINGIWDIMGGCRSVALAVFGTIFIYRQNGGASGQHFLQRYLAIGWVTAIRWLVFFLFTGFAFYTVVSLMAASEHRQTAWYDFVFISIMEVILYRNIGIHIRDVADRQKPV